MTKQSYEVGTIYRNVFLNSLEGRRALVCLLRDLYFFTSPVPPGAAVLRDHATGILEQMGIISDFNMLGIIDKMAELPDTRELPEEE